MPARPHTLLAIATLILASPLAARAAAPAYTVTYFPWGDSLGELVGIDNNGRIAGNIIAPGEPRGFTWQNGVTTFLPVPEGANYTRATAISTAGVLGWWAGDGVFGQPVWRADGTRVDLLNLPSNPYSNQTPSRLNDAGLVVGGSTDQQAPDVFVPVAARWDSAIPTSLGVPKGFEVSDARGVNQNGDIVGVAAYDGFSHVVIWREAGVQIVGRAPGFVQVSPISINTSDDILANAFNAHERTHALLWRSGEWIDLGAFIPGAEVWPTALNDSGDAVGRANINSLDSHAFLWSGGDLHDLNDLAINLDGGVLGEAADINAAGWIIGRAYHDGSTQGFLAIPVPTPGAALLIASGIAAMGLGRYRGR